LPQFTAVGTATPTNGNLDVSGTNKSVGTFQIDITDKWYYEVYVNAASNYDGPGWTTGASFNQNGSWGDNNSLFIYGANGEIYNNGWGSGYSTYTAGDTIGVGWDNGTVKFYKNNTLVHSYSSGVSAGTVVVPFAHGQSTMNFSYNFGQRPFAYTAPSGFKALCTTNLPTPDVVQGDTAFNTVIWTGDGTSSRAITGVGFQPDLVWDKMRSDAYQHAIVDAVRGGNQVLHSNSTSAEDTNWQYGYVSSFDTDGFTIQAGSTSAENWNLNGATFVAWNWKANGAGSSNTQGSITSTVSANTTAGISVVTYTGNGTAGATVGHGLGVKPGMIITKGRNTSGAWFVYHAALDSLSGYMQLQATAAIETSDDEVIYGNGSVSVAPTSSVFTIGDWSTINGSGNTFVSYCFAPVEGFSAFGSYTGNGSTDGPFVYTGFKPAFVMTKAISSGTTGNWRTTDDARNPYNVANYSLFPNLVNADSTNNIIDMLSNGFKMRETNTDRNGSGTVYIYMAFAENPFKYSLAR
jgi:hypothetical protein